MSLPVIGGGVFLRAVTTGTQAAEMSLPLTSIKLDTSIPLCSILPFTCSVNIHFWVVLLDEGRSLANDSYSPLLVCKNKDFTMEVASLLTLNRRFVSSTRPRRPTSTCSASSSPPCKGTFSSPLLPSSSRQLSRYILPIKFPFPNSLSHLPHPRSFLLTLSFSPTAPTCLYIDDYLCSQADSLFPFAVDASQLVLGADAPSLDRVLSPPLHKKDIASIPGLLVHSMLLSQGVVGEEFLSRKCILGPAMGAYDQLPPRPEPAETLLPHERLELPGGNDSLVRRFFADFSATQVGCEEKSSLERLLRAVSQSSAAGTALRRRRGERAVREQLLATAGVAAGRGFPAERVAGVHDVGERVG